MADTKQKKELFKDILIDIHLSAKQRDYIEKDAIMVEELSDKGFEVSRLWLGNSEFFDTFKGNMVGYYLGLCVNCFASGLSMADAWSDGENAYSDTRYDQIYDGGVWNNIFILLEMKSAYFHFRQINLLPKNRENPASNRFHPLSSHQKLHICHT